MPKIAPSVLTVPLNDVDKVLKQIKAADLVHIDVMDGHFVEQTTHFWDTKNVAHVKKHSPLPLITHLMVEHPKKVIKEFAKAGSTYISFHIECKDDIDETIKECKKHKLKVGIALNPATSLAKVIPYLKKIDYVLVMSVVPGLGGQKYMDIATKKIKELNKIRREQKLEFLIEVDGGIKDYNIHIPVNAGADIIVSGTGIVNAENKQEVIAKMKDVIMLGSDHGGYEFKEALKKHLDKKGLAYEDVGTHSTESADYPDFAKKVAKAIHNKEVKRGILICRSGAGMSVTANRYKGVFASLCLSKEMAEQAREHGNSNILCLGADLNTEKELLEIVDTWLTTPFSTEPRHLRRVKKIDMP